MFKRFASLDSLQIKGNLIYLYSLLYSQILGYNNQINGHCSNHFKHCKKTINNEHPIALRVTHNYKRKYYTINSLLTDQTIKFRCNAEHFKSPEAEDNGLGKFRKSFPNYKECNEILKAKLEHAQKILKRYNDLEVPFVFELFEGELKQKDIRKLITESDQKEDVVQVSISSYYEQQIKILEEQGRVGLAGLYYEVQRILNKFKPNALISDVNFRFLESFEYWMRNVRGNKDTTISVKMRNLQRVINQAIEDKLFKQEDYPFGEKKYSINKRLDGKTRKIAVTLDKISKLRELKLESDSLLYLTQQMFLFSFYSRGMNFVDMAYLKWSNVTDNYISYVRRKTGASFEIPINDYNRPILEYYRLNNPIKGDYVFPILDLSIHTTLKQQYTRKKTALKAVNDRLKTLATMIGEPKLRLTTNVGRHTYATGLKRSGANTAYITEALGHATQEQTQTYLAEFEKGEIETWENKMFEM